MFLRPPAEPSSATRGESNAASPPEASPSAFTADPTPPPSSAPTPTAAAPAYPTDSGSTLSEATQAAAAPLPPPASAPQSAHAEYRRLMQQRHRDRLNLHKDQVSFALLCSEEPHRQLVRLHTVSVTRQHNPKAVLTVAHQHCADTDAYMLTQAHICTDQ